jgi:hypothetical protein
VISKAKDFSFSRWHITKTLNKNKKKKLIKEKKQDLFCVNPQESE